MSNTKDNKPTTQTPQQSTQNPAPTEKKKLKLDVDDVSEVLERKISP